jgi:phage terminase large subunit-like protein
MVEVIQWQGRNVAVDWTLRELERVQCEDSLETFLLHAWRFIDPAAFKPGWVVGALAEHLEAVVDGEIQRLIINIPPRCLKSSLCSVAFPAWVWTQPYDSPTSGPGVPFLHASYAYSLALRDSVKCRRLIKSTWYRNLWGDRFHIIAEQDQKIRFQNSKGGERLITSVEASVTGEGGNIIIVDDPNNAREVLSDAIIKSTNEEWWDGAMPTRLNDQKTGAIIVIQQRLGERDLTGHILSKESSRWTHLVLPMEYEPARSVVTKIGWKDPRTTEGELLWPERFGYGEVRSLEETLKKWRAAGQLQQRPEPAGGGIIRRDWWQLWPPGGEDKDINGHILKQAAYPPCEFTIGALDTAYTEKTMNDPSAMTVWGVFAGDVVAQLIKGPMGTSTRVYVETSNRAILMAAWAEHHELHDLVMHTGWTAQNYQLDRMLIEDRAAGHSVAQELRRLLTSGVEFVWKGQASKFPRHRFGVQLINPRNMKNTAGEADKLARLYSVQHLFEEGMIYAPDRPWADAVITQCGVFPNGEHDDLVDTTSMPLRYLRDQGLLVRGVERTAEMDSELQFRSRDAPLYPGSTR